MRFCCFGFLIILAFAFCASAQVNLDALMSIEKRNITLYDTYHPAVLRVRGAFTQVDADGAVKTSIQVGSGFFISTDGEVLTTATVAHGADRVWVEYQGAVFPAKFLGADPDTNVALVRVLEPPRQFIAIPIPVQFEEPAIGAYILGITSPIEFKPTPCPGWVEGYDAQYGSHLFSTYHLRVSIGNRPGEGGSPIFDSQGRFLGMIVYTASALNASYVLTAPALNYVRDSLRTQGKVMHGYVGLDLVPVESIGEPPRIIVDRVLPNSPAEKAGFRRGDHILNINGRPIRDIGDIRHAAFFVYPGQFVSVGISRGGRSMGLTIQVGSPISTPDHS